MLCNVLCSISTKGRYETTLPLALSAVINQTLSPSKVIIYDDNETPVDLRNNQIFAGLFRMMELKGIPWEVVFGHKKGQHYNHQMANAAGFPWVWRVDDDCIPEPTVLETLWNHLITHPDTGAVGGAILVPTWNLAPEGKVAASNAIDDIYTGKPNKQWYTIDDVEPVDHLHCSFLYRAGVVNYNLNLSQVAHREETIFTYDLIKKGYQNYIVPHATSWHLKYNSGGIRTGADDMFRRDEELFRQYMGVNDFIVYLDNGIGDHVVFSEILDDVIEKHGKVILGCCYPDVFHDWKDNPNVTIKGIGDIKLMINPMDYNIYKCMIDWSWDNPPRPLIDAFRRLYL